MKRTIQSFAAFFCLLAFAACNDSGVVKTQEDSSSVNSRDSANATNHSAADNTRNSTTPTISQPLSKEDSVFTMKAAEGGIMEVESGNVALQNSANDRVKAFAQMMVNDHGKANSELRSLASGRGMTLPSVLPADKQKHIDGMKKMQGKAFDKHYIDMMINDHKKTISDFEAQAKSGTDTELKSWAEKTLPTLKMHRDSVMALSKIKL